LTNMARWSSG